MDVVTADDDVALLLRLPCPGGSEGGIMVTKVWFSTMNLNQN